MPENYTVEAVEGQREWTGNHGTFVDDKLRLTGLDKPVVVTRKPETPQPAPGQSLLLDVQPHPKFADALKGKKANPMPAANGVQTLGGGGDDVTRASIERQSSLRSAVEYACGFSQPPDADTVVQVAAKFYEWVSKS